MKTVIKDHCLIFMWCELKGVRMKIQNFMNKRSGFLVSFLMSLLTINSGCGEQRETPLPDENLSASLAEAGYAYPHPVDWNEGHVEFYNQHGAALKGTEKDCIGCHKPTDSAIKKGVPLNVSCATNCHTPTINGRRRYSASTHRRCFEA